MRDIAEAAAISLTEEGHDGQTYDIVSPTLISGPGNAALWSKLLGKEIKYGGHDFDQWEQGMRARMPGWSAYDLRMMLQGYFERGFASTETEVARLTRLLGHKPRSYEEFAAETADRGKPEFGLPSAPEEAIRDMEHDYKRYAQMRWAPWPALRCRPSIPKGELSCLSHYAIPTPSAR